MLTYQQFWTLTHSSDAPEPIPSLSAALMHWHFRPHPEVKNITQLNSPSTHHVSAYSHCPLSLASVPSWPLQCAAVTPLRRKPGALTPSMTSVQSVITDCVSKHKKRKTSRWRNTHLHRGKSAPHQQVQEPNNFTSNLSLFWTKFFQLCVL